MAVHFTTDMIVRRDEPRASRDRGNVPVSQRTRSVPSLTSLPWPLIPGHWL